VHDHLSPSVVPLLSEPDDIRIEHIQKGAWLGLEDAMAALKRMDAMLHHPTVPRMPNLLLVGPSFSGKTSILHKFVSNHLPNQAPEREATVCPVVMVEAPPKPDISDFYSRILDAMFAHVRHTASPHQKYFQIKQLFRELSVKMLIIACNTMAAVAGDAVRERSPVPVLDVIDAGARAAVDISRKGIGVIGTPTTINSNAYARNIHALNPDLHVYSQACPLFVPLVEEGWLDHEVTRLTAKEYLKPVFVESIDALVLGCTHYPLLKSLLQEVAGPGIKLVDSAITIAEQTARVLTEMDMHNPQRQQPEYRYVVTDVPLRFQTVGGRFLGRELTQLEQVRW